MAKTQQAKISMTVQDEIGVKASVTTYLLIDPAITVTQLQGLWNSQAALLDPVIDGAILHGDASIVMTPTGLKTTPVAGARVEQTGLFTFGNTANPRSFGEDIASWASGKIVGGKIPLTDSAVAAFLAPFTTPVTLSEYTTNYFAVLSALRSAAVTFRKHRRAERTLTFEL